MNAPGSRESHLRGLSEVRRQVGQSRADAALALEAAQRTRDQRRVDFLAGKVASLQSVLDVIDIEIDTVAEDDDGQRRTVGRIRSDLSSFFPFTNRETWVQLP